MSSWTRAGSGVDSVLAADGWISPQTAGGGEPRMTAG